MSKNVKPLQDKSVKWYVSAALVSLAAITGVSYVVRLKDVGDKLQVEQKLVDFDLPSLKITLNVKLINQVNQTVNINYPITTLFYGDKMLTASLKKDQVVTIPALGSTNFNLDFFINLSSLGSAAIGIVQKWAKGDAVAIKAVTVSRLRTVTGLLNMPIQKVDIIPVFKSKKAAPENGSGTKPDSEGIINWGKIRDKIGF